MNYELKRLQYAAVYSVSERTVRRWQEKGFPLDDPEALLRELDGQKNRPRSLIDASDTDLWNHLEAEAHPEKLRLDVQRELAFRISNSGRILRNARDLARTRREDWPEIVARINAIAEKINDLLPLIGVNEEEFEWDEQMRSVYLRNEGLIYYWGGDPERDLGETKRLVWADEVLPAAAR
jgi:hypothetical protein